MGKDADMGEYATWQHMIGRYHRSMASKITRGCQYPVIHSIGLYFTWDSGPCQCIYYCENPMAAGRNPMARTFEASAESVGAKQRRRRYLFWVALRYRYKRGLHRESHFHP